VHTNTVLASGSPFTQPFCRTSAAPHGTKVR
jgi:hypothetical protein